MLTERYLKEVDCFLFIFLGTWLVMASKWWQLSAEPAGSGRSSWQCTHHPAAPQDAAPRRFIQSSSPNPHKLLQMFTSLAILDAVELAASTSHYKGKYSIF